jgi:Tol biopolymer transport system component
VYVQSNGDGHYLGLVTSGGEVLNGGLHQFAAAPAWSPTGGQIAFFGEPGISHLGGSYSAGNGLWLLDATQPNTVPSWQIKAEDHIKNIAWSPDGTKIAYETTPPNVTSAIVVVDAQGGADISRFPGAQPAWSPNSQQLIIKTCAPDCGLWQVNFDGSGVQQQTFDASDSYPTWSLNNQVAFSTSRDSNWEIYLLNLNNSSLSRVTQRPSTDITPVFSADGREIYLRTDYYGGWRITALALDGSNERTVKEGVGESTDWGLARPAIH